MFNPKCYGNLIRMLMSAWTSAKSGEHLSRLWINQDEQEYYRTGRKRILFMGLEILENLQFMPLTLIYDDH